MKRKHSGVATVIGGLLLLTVIVLWFSLHMFSVAPKIGSTAEYEATNNVYDDISKLRFTIDDAADTGRIQTMRVNTKVDYPIFAFEQNPMQYQYNSESASVTISNYNNSDSQFLDGKTGDPITYSSERFNITFSSANERQLNDHTVGFEHGVKYRYEDGADLLGTQPVVNERTITLYLLDSNLGIARGNTDDTWTVDSTQFNETNVQPDGDSLTITLQTRASEDAWRERLRSQFDENGGYITNIQYTANSDSINEIDIVFDGSENYTIYTVRATVE